MGFFSRKKARAPPAPDKPLPPVPLRVRTRSPPRQQPSGVVEPPPDCEGNTAQPPPSYTPPQQTPIVVNNHHYYLLPAPPPDSQPTTCPSLADLASSHQVLHPSIAEDTSHSCGSEHSHPLADQICERFNDVMTRIDHDRYAGNERELFTYNSPPPSEPRHTSRSRHPRTSSSSSSSSSSSKPRKTRRTTTAATAATTPSGGYFAKAQLYANSRLPRNLAPLRLYLPTWPLLCLAAQYSERVYAPSTSTKPHDNITINAAARPGTKAMVIASVPLAPNTATIVLAIRGTASFMDWAVNLRAAPASPAGFLADARNGCHAGFLAVARRMVRPVAARLRALLDDASPAKSSLLITGHSAGGAVAALLYAHMVQQPCEREECESELRALTRRFKRVHCVTFGAPPVSLLPLRAPRALRKSVFLSFVNEGDPVARADRAYVRSLLELFATPAPAPGDDDETTTTWPLPPATLSNAGRIVVLRAGDEGEGARARVAVRGRKTVEERLNEGVVAQVASDELLRQVVWGDPVCHVMKLYAGRLETLAVNAVTAKGC